MWPSAGSVTTYAGDFHKVYAVRLPDMASVARGLGRLATQDPVNGPSAHALCAGIRLFGHHDHGSAHCARCDLDMHGIAKSAMTVLVEAFTSAMTVPSEPRQLYNISTNRCIPISSRNSASRAPVHQ